MYPQVWLGKSLVDWLVSEPVRTTPHAAPAINQCPRMRTCKCSTLAPPYVHSRAPSDCRALWDRLARNRDVRGGGHDRVRAPCIQNIPPPLPSSLAFIPPDTTLPTTASTIILLKTRTNTFTASSRTSPPSILPGAAPQPACPPPSGPSMAPPFTKCVSHVTLLVYV